MARSFLKIQIGEVEWGLFPQNYDESSRAVHSHRTTPQFMITLITMHKKRLDLTKKRLYIKHFSSKF